MEPQTTHVNDGVFFFFAGSTSIVLLSLLALVALKMSESINLSGLLVRICSINVSSLVMIIKRRFFPVESIIFSKVQSKNKGLTTFLIFFYDYSSLRLKKKVSTRSASSSKQNEQRKRCLPAFSSIAIGLDCRSIFKKIKLTNKVFFLSLYVEHHKMARFFVSDHRCCSWWVRSLVLVFLDFSFSSSSIPIVVVLLALIR